MNKLQKQNDTQFCLDPCPHSRAFTVWMAFRTLTGDALLSAYCVNVKVLYRGLYLAI